MKKIVVLICLLIFISCSTHGVEVSHVVKKLDDLFRSSASIADVEMTIITPRWERTLHMKTWSRGTERTFIRIYEPARERGVGTLKIGNEMWNYLPRTHKIIKIPPSMMMSSWMGSDFKNDDLVKEYTFFDDYSCSFIKPGQSEKGRLYLECVPKEGRPIIWGKVIITLFEADLLPERYEYYDEKGRLMRRMTFGEKKMFSGRLVPSVMILEPMNKEGNKTILKYRDIRFEADVDINVFSLRNLRKGL